MSSSMGFQLVSLQGFAHAAKLFALIGLSASALVGCAVVSEPAMVDASATGIQYAALRPQYPAQPAPYYIPSYVDSPQYVGPAINYSSPGMYYAPAPFYAPQIVVPSPLVVVPRAVVVPARPVVVAPAPVIAPPRLVATPAPAIGLPPSTGAPPIHLHRPHIPSPSVTGPSPGLSFGHAPGTHTARPAPSSGAPIARFNSGAHSGGSRRYR